MPIIENVGRPTIITGDALHEFAEFECGCYFDKRCSPTGEVIALVTHMCGWHFDEGFAYLDIPLRDDPQLRIPLPS